MTLFDRSGKYPVLTEPGERLYQQGRVLLRQAERMRAYAEAVNSDVEEKLVVGLGPMIPFSIMETPLEKLGRTFPNTRVKVVRDQNEPLQQLVREGVIDMVLQAFHEATPDSLHFKNAGLLRWGCVCSPDFELADMDRIDNETLLITRQIILEAMLSNPMIAQGAILSQDVWTASDQEDMMRMVEQGLGWAYIPLALFQEREQMGALVQFTPEFQTNELLVQLEMLIKPRASHGPALTFLMVQLAQTERY